VNLAAGAPGGAPAAAFVPYIHGATTGCPSRGRPEKVLAYLKTMTLTQQEDGLGRDVRGTVPGGQSRNGMPERRGYVYRGTGEDALTGRLSDWRLRREAKAAVTGPEFPLAKPARKAACADCGAPKPDHLLTCGKAVRLAPAPAPKPVPRPGPKPKAGPKPKGPRRSPVLTTACPGCGRPKPDKYVTCAGAGPCLAPRQAPEPEPVPEPVPAKRHRKCGYPFGSVGHGTVCGGAA
jgi:hypothetical protein